MRTVEIEHELRKQLVTKKGVCGSVNVSTNIPKQGLSRPAFPIQSVSDTSPRPFLPILIFISLVAHLPSSRLSPTSNPKTGCKAQPSAYS